jgi:sigma-B regulation protein RsbU (phosphoserine phosphatase)
LYQIFYPAIFVASQTKSSPVINADLPTVLEEKDQGLIGLLLKRQAELNSLLEVTQAINENSTPSVLFEMLELISKVHLKIRKMRLLIKEGDYFYCAVRFGGPFESSKNIQQMSQTLRYLNNIQSLSEHEDKLLNNYDFFVPVLHKDEMLAYVLIGDFDITEFSGNDLNFMQTLINVIVVALENKKLFKERVHRELLQHEIELAREVQNMLVPLYLPYDSTVEVGALYKPSQNIGGDYFDFIRLNDHEFLWCIADVSGKGMPAALLMASLQASLRAWVDVEFDLFSLVVKLNQVVYRNTKGERFITLFIAKYDQDTRTMKYINAGHNPPVLVMGDQSKLLKDGSTMLGAFDVLPFINIGSETLVGESLIFNYTDGMVESADENVFIDQDELIAHVKANSHHPVNELNAELLKDIQLARKAKMNTDDITLMSVKIF